MANRADFSIDNDAGSRGYDLTPGSTPTLRLRDPSKARKWQVQVYDAADETSPLASSGAPTLTLENEDATTGQKVTAKTPAGTIEISAGIPATNAASHSWIVRSIVNDGLDANGNADATLVHERLFTVRNTASNRKLVAYEGSRYSTAGPTDAVNDVIETQQATGALPTPANPGDDGKVLVADGGAWVVSDTQTTVPVPADPADDGKVLVADGGAWVVSSAPKLASVDSTTVGGTLTLGGSAATVNLGNQASQIGESQWYINLTSGVAFGIGATTVSTKATGHALVHGSDGNLQALAPSALVSTPDATKTVQTTDATKTTLDYVVVPDDTWVEAGVLVYSDVAEVFRSINLVAYRSGGAATVLAQALDGFTVDETAGVTVEAEVDSVAVSDAAFTQTSGAFGTITSAGGNLPDVSVGDVVRCSDTTGNDGLYLVTLIGTPGESWSVARQSAAVSTAAAEPITIERGIAINVTGIAATTIDWVCNIQSKSRTP